MCLSSTVTDDPENAAVAASDAHARVRALEPFQAQLNVLNSLTHGFVVTLRAAWLAATRDPASVNALFWRFIDDLLASAVGIELLVREGVDSMARRELRFMLELVVRDLYVDICVATPTTTLEIRLAYVEHRLGKRDIELLNDLPFMLFADGEAFREATRTLYGELSRYVHPMHEQLARRLEQAERGVYIGFETADDLSAFNDLLRRSYDVLLVYVFEALGQASAGDLMLAFDDVEDWPFHQTRFVAEVSRAFDYKAERQGRRPSGERDRG
jgi:hypothetical protein